MKIDIRRASTYKVEKTVTVEKEKFYDFIAKLYKEEGCSIVVDFNPFSGSDLECLIYNDYIE